MNKLDSMRIARLLENFIGDGVARDVEQVIIYGEIRDTDGELVRSWEYVEPGFDGEELQGSDFDDFMYHGKNHRELMAGETPEKDYDTSTTPKAENLEGAAWLKNL